MNGSEAVVKMLQESGIRVMFGLCGDTSLPLYEALGTLQPGICHVLCRDERGAAYMADAYARLSGKVGVCEAPSGGGAMYLLPGVAEANQSSVPLVAITSDIEAGSRDRGTLTELDQSALFTPVTRWSRTPAHTAELPRSLREAFRRASTGGLGATHLGLPWNVQTGPVAADEVYGDCRYSEYPADRCAPDPEAVRRVCRLLRESRRPMIVAGAGVIRSEAWDAVTRLAELLGCPVATSISGKGSIAEVHPYALGVIGSNGGLEYRHELLRASDLVFLVGCQGGSVTTNKWTLPNRGVPVVQLDVDPSRIGRNYRVKEGIVADARLGLEALVDELDGQMGGRSAGKVDPELIAHRRRAYLSSIDEFGSDEMPIRPERFLTELFAVLPQDAIILTDPGTPTPYVAAYYRLPKAGRWYATPRAHGALGYTLPAVVGASFAQPRHKVIGIMGDGSFGLAVGELETIARLQIPVALVVLSNSAFGWIKAGQRVRGRGYYNVDFSRTDHAQVARAYGLKGLRVEEPAGLRAALREAVESPAPVLVDVLSQPLEEARAPVSNWIA